MRRPRARRLQVDGVIATNTTVPRLGVQKAHPLAPTKSAACPARR
jgi:dihydroorotate dehydrogenase